MDPIALATITSAVAVLATEAGKASASEAGKTAWGAVKTALGWQPNDGTAMKDLAPKVATELLKRPELASEIVKLLRAAPADLRSPSSLVERIDAERVIVGTVNVGGDFHMG